MWAVITLIENMRSRADTSLLLTLLPRDKWTDNALINWPTSPPPSHDQQRQCTGVRAQYWVHSIHSSSSRQMSVLLLHNYHVICLTVIFAMKFSTSVSGSLGSWQLAGCLAKVEMLWLVSLSLCVTCDVTYLTAAPAAWHNVPQLSSYLLGNYQHLMADKSSTSTPLQICL